MGLMSAARYRNVTVRGQSRDTGSEEAEEEDVHITSNVEMANTDNQKNIGGRAGIYAIGCGGARRRLALLIGPARHHIPPSTCPVRLAPQAPACSPLTALASALRLGFRDRIFRRSQRSTTTQCSARLCSSSRRLRSSTVSPTPSNLYREADARLRLVVQPHSPHTNVSREHVPLRAYGVGGCRYPLRRPLTPEGPGAAGRRAPERCRLHLLASDATALC